MKVSDEAAKKVLAAILQAIRDDGMIIVPNSPTATMVESARHVSVDLTDAQIEEIYLQMTKAWLDRSNDVGTG